MRAAYVLAPVAAAVAACLVFAWYRPLTVLGWASRISLKRARLTKHTAETAAGRLVYWRGGSGPTLLLLHGAGHQAGSWALVAARLSERYRLLIPDLPGHGGSDPRDGPLRLGTILAGTVTLIEQESGGKPVTVVGNSMGAWVAMLLAQRHPNLVHRIVLVNGGGFAWEDRGISLMPRSRDEARRTVEALRDPASPRVPPNVLDDIVRTARSGPIARMAQDPADMARHFMEGTAGQITVATDLLWGESDRLLTMEYARKLAAAIPSARITTIPRCGHVPQQECPERFVESLIGVLESGTRHDTR
ncbi:MAG: alpha/beta hydrolase [Acidobacteria bacterium]|nr:alpha/beta hydrolase [Acidobacteriota bacterium]